MYRIHSLRSLCDAAATSTPPSHSLLAFVGSSQRLRKEARFHMAPSAGQDTRASGRIEGNMPTTAPLLEDLSIPRSQWTTSPPLVVAILLRKKDPPLGALPVGCYPGTRVTFGGATVLQTSQA